MLRFSDEADVDLERLFEYIADGSSDPIARTFVATLVARCRHLADLPAILGTARPELAPGLRSTPHKGYIIYFRYLNEAIEIVNILDARRDVLAYFGSDDADD